MNKGKIIAIGVVVSALAVGAYLYFKKGKKKEEETPVDETKEEPVKQDSPSVSTQTTATTPPPVIVANKPQDMASKYNGKSFKSRGENKFNTYSYKDVTEEVVNADKTVTRKVVNKLTKDEVKYTRSGTKGMATFKDGQLIGKVFKVTPSGFFISLGNGKYIWSAPQHLIA